jgi:hypothetical protein
VFNDKFFKKKIRQQNITSIKPPLSESEKMLASARKEGKIWREALNPIKKKWWR